VSVGAALGAVLVAAAVLAAATSIRLHAAVREAARELRDGERRLEPHPHEPGRRLEDELRWYADVAAVPHDSRWRFAAAVVAVLAGIGLVVGLVERPVTLPAAGVLVALVLVPAWLIADGVRAEAALRPAVGRVPLAPVRRLEDALVRADRDARRAGRAHRSWLRTAAAGYPGAPLVARRRAGSYARAAARHGRALATLRRAAAARHEPAVRIRPPAGYAEGLRGLRTLLTDPTITPLATPPRPPVGGLKDDAWAAAVADLSRAAELDGDRRSRWLFAAAACAELRDDPPARESAARWSLAALATPRRPLGPPRTDPLPDAVAVEPRRPDTWAAAVRRARTTTATPELLAEAVLRWAYALVRTAPGTPAADAIDPAVTEAAAIMADLPDPDPYLRIVRPGFEQLGARSAQLSRLVPLRPVAPAPAPAS